MIKRELGEDVECVIGGPGEFTVWVDGREVASKTLFVFFPSDKKVLASVRAALSKP